MEKCTHFTEKVLTYFSNVMENLMRKPMCFPSDEAYHRMGT